MTFEDLMAEAGRRLGVDIVVDEGATQLIVDEMEVSILEMPELESVVLNGVVGEPPPQGLAELHKAMLEANYNFAGTAGSTLSVNPDGGALTLTRLVPLATLDADRFLSLLEGFVNVLEAWRKIVADYRPDESAPADAAGPSIGAGFLQV